MRIKAYIIYIYLFEVFILLILNPSYSNESNYLQSVYIKLQQALAEYKLAVTSNPSNKILISEKLAKYNKLKEEYESLKNKISLGKNLDLSNIKSTYKPFSTQAFVNETIDMLYYNKSLSEKELDIIFPETFNNRLEIQTGEEFWQSLYKDITNAKKSITINMFGIEGDELGWDFAKLLAKKAKEGVEIIIVADRVGARMSKPKMLISETEEEKLFKFCENNGIKVVFYDRITMGTNLKTKLDFYHFDHRKMFVIDGKIGYIGGYTLQKSSRERKHDLMVRCEGDVVNQMQVGILRSFLYNRGKLSKRYTKEEIYDRFFATSQNNGSVNAKIAFNIPRGNHEVHDTYIKAIDSAKNYLFIINPYINNKDLVFRICNAAKRGVDVRLVLPSSPENPLNDANMRFYFDEFIKAGVKIYLYKGEKGLGKVHAKGLITDDNFASIGSCNMDTMALRHNYEANILSKDPNFVKQIRQKIFEQDFKVSEIYEYPTSFYERMKIKVRGFFAKLIERIN